MFEVKLHTKRYTYTLDFLKSVLPAVLKKTPAPSQPTKGTTAMASAARVVPNDAFP